MLLRHARLVFARESEQAVQVPADLAATGEIGIAPFHRVVVVRRGELLVAFLQVRIDHRLAQRVPRLAGNDPHSPWLHVGAGGRAARKGEDLGHGATRHRVGPEGPHAATGKQRLLDGERARAGGEGKGSEGWVSQGVCSEYQVKFNAGF
jgi:hypothetical protein